MTTRYERTPGGALTLILKTTNICNIACKYCSVGPAGRARLTWPDYERIAIEVERIVDRWKLRQFTLTFHGGEATAMGAEFLARACDRMLQLPIPVFFNMQTNLYKVTDDFIEVARRYRLRLGTSIDPIGAERIAVDGTDTWPRWKENYARMCAEGFDIGAIFVVTKDAAHRAEEVYTACEELNQYTRRPFGLQLNAVYPQGRAGNSPDAPHPELNIAPEWYGRFLVDMYDLWEERGRSLNLSPIANFVATFAAKGRLRSGLMCTFREGCAGTHVGVDYSLDVAGCGRRLDSAGIFGNLRKGHLDDLIADSEEQQGKARRAEELLAGECNGCRFFAVCHGGCPDEAETTNGHYMRKSAWCQSYLMLFDAIEKRQGSVGHTFAQPGAVTDREEAVVVLVGHEPAHVTAGPPARHLERWLVPSADGCEFLDEDSDLDGILNGTHLLRLYVPNDDVIDLNRHSDLVRDPRVVVSLYQADNLLAALNLLNALDASVTLDVLAILKDGGADVLNAALDRYATDPMWNVQVGPFAAFLFYGARGERSPLANRWGLRPGSYGVQSPEAWSPPEDIRSIVDALHRAQPDDRDQWPHSHAGCVECRHLSICGGRFAEGNSQPCSEAAMALVDRLAEFGDELRRHREALHADCDSTHAGT